MGLFRVRGRLTGPTGRSEDAELLVDTGATLLVLPRALAERLELVARLKLVDEKDPSIRFVDDGEHFHLYLGTDDVEATAEALRKRGIRFAKDVHETPWGTKEFVIKDNQGHTLYFGGSR